MNTPTRPSGRVRSLIRTAVLAAMLLIAPGCASPKNTPDQHEKKGSGGAGAVATVVARSTVGATLKAPVRATRTGAVVFYDRLHTLLVGNAAVPAKATEVDGRLLPQAGGEAFEALLDRQKLPRRSAGTVKFYVNGTTFFPVYLQAIRGARQSLDVQTFIFDTDDVAVEVADALKAKSAEIPVRVYFDGAGSTQAANVTPKSMPKNFTPPKDILEYLTTGSQVQARQTANAYFLADHSKLHVIDGRYAFVGGMNIGREYRYEWHDLMARVEGPIVPELSALFERHWRGDAWWRKLSPKADHAAAVTAPGPPAGELLPLRLLLTDSRNGRREVLKATLLALRCASRRIWLETPYFSSDQVMTELEAALKRGVDVRIVVPEKVDHKIMEANNAADLQKLIQQGAKVYAYPGMTHLKATICDDWGMFGSANYDTLSQRINAEMNLASSDPRLVQALARQVFQPDFRTARRVSAGELKAKGGAFAEFVGDQL